MASDLSSPTTPTPMLGPAEMVAVRNRLHRVQGQVGAVVTMLEEGRGCSDVVQVIAAATAALQRTGILVLNNALHQCVANPEATPDDLAQLEKLFLKLA